MTTPEHDLKQILKDSKKRVEEERIAQQIMEKKNQVKQHTLDMQDFDNFVKSKLTKNIKNIRQLLVETANRGESELWFLKLPVRTTYHHFDRMIYKIFHGEKPLEWNFIFLDFATVYKKLLPSWIELVKNNISPDITLKVSWVSNGNYILKIIIEE